MFSKIPPILSRENPVRKWLILLNLIVITTLAFVSSNSTVILETLITSSLAVDGALASWITISFLLGINTFVPISNRLADRFGYKQIFGIGVCMFSLATLIAGCANGFFSLAFARLLEGIGSGLIFPSCLAIIVKEFPKERLQLALNTYLGTSFTLGFSLGSIFSGYCGFYFLWQYAFLLLLPFCVFSLLFTLLFHEETEKINRGPFDFLGFFFFSSFIVLFLIVLSEGNLPSTAQGWYTPYIIICAVASILSFIAMVLIESGAPNPIFPLGLFRYSTFNLGCMTLFTIGMVAFSSVNLAVEYMEHALFYDRYLMGKMISFYGLFLGIGNLIAARLLRVISTGVLSILGLSLLSASLLMNTSLDMQSSQGDLFSLFALRGFSLGISIGPITSASLKALPKELGSDGSTIITFFRQVGATFGSSVIGIIAIRRNLYHQQLFMEPVHNQLSAYKIAAPRLETEVFAQHPVEAIQRAEYQIVDYIYRQAYVQSLNDALFAFGLFILLIAGCLFCIHCMNYFRKNSHEAKHLEEKAKSGRDQ